MLKESETDKLSTPWANVRKKTLLQAMAPHVSAIRTDIATKPMDVLAHNEPVRLNEPTIIRPFESLIVWAKTKTIFTTGRLRDSTFTLGSKEGGLPPGLVVTNMHAILKCGNKRVPVVLHNTMGSPISLKKGWKIAQEQTSNEVPKPLLSPVPLSTWKSWKVLSQHLLWLKGTKS